MAKDETKRDRLATVLYNLVESITYGASLLEPFMPETASKIVKQLHTELRSFEEMDSFGKYPSGTKVTETPEILFARLDLKEVVDKAEAMFAERSLATNDGAEEAKEQEEAVIDTSEIKEEPSIDTQKLEQSLKELLNKF